MVFRPAVRDYLKAFLAIRGIDSEPLFHLSSAGIGTTFRRIQVQLGLKKFHPHQLRHQFATSMLRDGVSLELIGVMLGHEDYNTTRRYISLDESDIQGVHNAASSFEALANRLQQTPAKRRPRY